jgi:3-hydroxybutyryl-CoA dehydrogenase
MSTAPKTVGVVGAGTMGAGIAQLAAQAGARTLLHDPVPEALARGRGTIEQGLAKLVAKGRMAQEEADAVLGRVELCGALEDLAPCDLIVEAAPERLELKLQIFGALAAVVRPDTVLATNTSSLSVTEIAAGVPRPERVVGLHFFNPAPVMRLVEVVAGVQTAPEVVAVARATGEAMGKHVIDAADVPGFLVNRVNRPFFLEALQLVTEGVATVEQVDRTVRMGGGYRMGPFELMDLIGIETNHAVAEGFFRQTYGEPRYRPSPLAARMVAAGRLGRKTGQGWYAYPDGRPQDPAPPEAGGGDGRALAILGDLPVLDALREAATAAGFAVTDDPRDAWLTVGSGTCLARIRTARVVLLAHGSLHATDPEAAGLHVLAPLGRLAELTRTDATDPVSAERAEELVRCLGLHPEWVGDAAGLVLGRLVAQLANEAAFLIGEGHGTPEDVDAGLELGLNHPCGPIAWRAALGAPHVVGLLDALHAELGEPRYRVAPLLRREAALAAVPQRVGA